MFFILTERSVRPARRSGLDHQFEELVAEASGANGLAAAS
jgi:hypothetical protein